MAHGETSCILKMGNVNRMGRISLCDSLWDRNCGVCHCSSCIKKKREIEFETIA